MEPISWSKLTMITRTSFRSCMFHLTKTATVMDEILHQFETMGETMVCWYLQGISRNQVFLGGAKWFLSIHSITRTPRIAVYMACACDAPGLTASPCLRERKTPVKGQSTSPNLKFVAQCFVPVYVYIYIYIYIYICLFIYLFSYLFIYVCVYIDI